MIPLVFLPLFGVFIYVAAVAMVGWFACLCAIAECERRRVEQDPLLRRWRGDP